MVRFGVLGPGADDGPPSIDQSCFLPNLLLGRMKGGGDALHGCIGLLIDAC